jgi:NAD(P)-dependent dehydrogenase (short-subunit alcohol dehydrogenase family)
LRADANYFIYKTFIRQAEASIPAMARSEAIRAAPGAEAALLPLSGRHALVSGGGTGIGAAIAGRLAALGASLTLLGRRREPLASRAAALTSACGRPVGLVAADVTEEAAVAAALREAAAARGAPLILVNNAGAARSAPFQRTSRALWEEMLAVNLTGAYLMTRAALPAMREAGWGRIVNIASTAGLTGYRYVSAYCAAKHGLVGLTRALALELAETGVTVNAVCPGFTDTDLLADAVAAISEATGTGAAAARAGLAAHNPQKRLIAPAEVANAVAWLCLPDSGAITGQSIAVAGGEVM